MYDIIRLLIRTVILFIPAVLLLVLSILNIIGIVLKNFIYYVFNIQSYWNAENAWYELTEDVSRWYKFWLHGVHKGDY